jgi:VRR-NUC domain
MSDVPPAADRPPWMADPTQRRRPRAPRMPTEHEEQAAVIAWANAHADRRLRLLFAIPNAGRRSMGALSYYLAEGLKPGVPDLFLPVPVAPYHGAFIEMKRRGRSTTSTEQLRWLADLGAAGYAVHRCVGAEQAIGALCRYLQIPPPVIA